MWFGDPSDLIGREAYVKYEFSSEAILDMQRYENSFSEQFCKYHYDQMNY